MQLQTRVRREEIRCPFCHDQIGPELDKTGCESCMAWHHTECWSTHGGCSSCGYTRDLGPGLVVRTSDLDPTPRITPRARPGQCAAPGCRTRIPLVSTPQLCAAHRPEVLEPGTRDEDDGLVAVLKVLLAPIWVPLFLALFPFVVLFWGLVNVLDSLSPAEPSIRVGSPNAAPPALSDHTPSPDYA